MKLCFIWCLQYLEELGSKSAFYCMSTSHLLFTHCQIESWSPHRDCTCLRMILEKKTLNAVAHDLAAVRIYGSWRLLKKTSLLRVKRPVVTLCRFSYSSSCAYLPTIIHFYRHFNMIDKILTNNRPAKAPSISLVAPWNPTYTAAYLSMKTDQLIWSPRSRTMRKPWWGWTLWTSWEMLAWNLYNDL